MRLMRELVREFNVYRWAAQMLIDAARLRKRERIRAKRKERALVAPWPGAHPPARLGDDQHPEASRMQSPKTNWRMSAIGTKRNLLSGLAARPLLGVKRTLPVMVVHGLGSGPIN